MKKIIIFLAFISSILSFSKEVVGYTRYLDEKTIMEIKEVEDVNMYLDKKFPDLYYSEIEEDTIHIYPRLQFIKVNSKYFTEEYILEMFPELKIGRAIFDENLIINLKNTEMIKLNDMVDLYYRYSIDEEGRIGVIIDEYNKKGLKIDISLKGETSEKKLRGKISGGGFRSTDKVTLELGINSSNSVTLDLGYNIYNFKRNEIYTVEAQLDSQKKIKLGTNIFKLIAANNYIDHKSNTSVNGYLRYQYNDTNDKLQLGTDVKYSVKFKTGANLSTKVGLLLEKGIIKEDFSGILSSNFEIYKGGAESYKVELSSDFLLSFLPLKNYNKIRYINAKGMFKPMEADLVYSLKLRAETPKILFTKAYLFNDLVLGLDFDKKFKYNNATGVGIVSDYLPIDIDTYVGFGISSEKMDIIAGIKLEYNF